MRRTTRLFELIQLLRSARAPMTAAAMASAMEVTPRTVYRDIASLQATGVPILGEAGVGYVMRPGYDLPPLMLTVEEVEAVTVALGLLARTGDRGLKAAALSVEGKIAAVLPGHARPSPGPPSLHASGWGIVEPETVDLGAVRGAIRNERKLAIGYRDEKGRETTRTIRPIAVIYYVEVIAIAAWCELRGGFRHFRADRIASCLALDEDFAGEGSRLRQAWWRHQSEAEAALRSRPETPRSPVQTAEPLLSRTHDDA